jgi:hypothetical protein
LDGEPLRDGIFALYTRRFGSVAEFMVKRLIRCGKAKNQFHDLYDDVARHRVEVKFSVVRKKSETPISEETVVQCILEATAEQRMVGFADWRHVQFDCNIQQIKRAEFDVLYYGLFFADCVKIFRISSGAIGSDIYYSDKQHKGNVGEGQFHINQDTLGTHLERYLWKTLSYDELYELLR